MYKFLLHSNIEKEFQKIPLDIAAKIAKAMRDLCNDPRLTGSRKIGENIYRLPMGNYRIIYVVFDNEQMVFVSKVARRSEMTYRDIDNLIKTARLYIEQEKLKK